MPRGSMLIPFMMPVHTISRSFPKIVKRGYHAGLVADVMCWLSNHHVNIEEKPKMPKVVR